VEVVDHQQAARARRRGPASVASTASNSRWRAPRPGSWPGCRTSAAPTWRSASAYGLEGRQRLLPAAAEQHRRAAVEHLAREAIGEPRLADARLAREQDDPVAAVRVTPAHARRSRSSSRRGRRTRVVGGAGERGAGVAAVLERLDQARGLARRRDRELRAQPLGEAPARGQRRRAVAGAARPLDQAPVRLLGERVERDLLAREAGPPRRLRARRELPRAPREPLGVGAARLVRPVVLEAVEDRRRGTPPPRPRPVAAPQRRRRTRARRPPAPAPSSATVSRVGDDVLRRRAERAPQLAQRGAQARARDSSRTSGQNVAASLPARVRARG
jgi:hypothetical protein